MTKQRQPARGHIRTVLFHESNCQIVIPQTRNIDAKPSYWIKFAATLASTSSY